MSGSPQQVFVMDEFVDAIRLIEELHFIAGVGHTKEALNTLYSAIKLLNRLAREEYDVVDISRYCMAHYDLIKLKLYTISQRLLWLLLKLGTANRRLLVLLSLAASAASQKSKLLGTLGDTTATEDDLELMPPIIHFSDKELLIEFDRDAIVDAKVMPLPNIAEVEFQRIQFSHWSTDGCGELFQDMLPNCLFVLLLLSVLEKLDLSQLVFPHKPLTNYRIKLHFNGCWRIVTVDNLLPLIRKLPRSLIVRLYADPMLLWPALIEKGYLKVMGQGYEFSGLNMALDTFMLTGWVPEIVLIKNYQLPADFEDIWRQSLLGKCVVGLGTGKLSKELGATLGLTPHHDYVFEFYLKMKLEIIVKNPWIKLENHRDRFVKVHNLCPFQYLYINWDVKTMFRYSRLVNFVYLANDDVNNLIESPQYYLTNPTLEPLLVWLFLEFHLNPTTMTRANHHVIGFQIFQTSHGERVLLYSQYPCVAGADSDTNNRLRLVKFTMEPHLSYTMLASLNFTGTFSLTVYDNIGPELKFGKAGHLYNHVHQLEGELNFSNLGGLWAHSSYIYNPQYDVNIKEDVLVVLAIFATKLDTMINIHLFRSDPSKRGLPIREFDKANLILNENYNPGSQYYHFPDIPKGLYKMVVSAYDPRLLEKFKIYFNYLALEKSKVSIHPISTLLGLFVKTLAFDLKDGNRHKLGFSVDHFNTKFTIHIKNYSENALGVESPILPLLMLFAHTGMVEVITSYRPAIRGSIFKAENGTPVQVNQDWDNSVYGLFLEVTIPQPGSYILLVERFEASQGRIVVDFGCNKSFTLI